MKAMCIRVYNRLIQVTGRVEGHRRTMVEEESKTTLKLEKIVQAEEPPPRDYESTSVVPWSEGEGRRMKIRSYNATTRAIPDMEKAKVLMENSALANISHERLYEILYDANLIDTATLPAPIGQYLLNVGV